MELRRALPVAALAVAVASCGNDKLPPPRALLAVPTVPRLTANEGVTVPSALPAAPAVRECPKAVGADWLEAPTSGDCSAAEECELPSFGALRVLAVGKTTIVVATRLGIFTLRDDLGLAGPFDLPGAPDLDIVQSVGLGTHERLVYADSEGRVWSHDGEKFEARGQVPGATAWDFAHGILAAINEQGLSVSEDGQYFRQARSGPLDAVLVRNDGVIVVRRNHAIDISRDRGWTWSGSYIDGSYLTRLGQWISVCRDTTLSADGEQWVKTPSHPDWEHQWLAAFRLARTPGGHAEGNLDWRALQAAPPTKSKQAQRGSVGCSLGALPNYGLLGRQKRPVPLTSGLKAVAAWPVAPRVRATRSTYAFLADGACKRTAANRTSGECPPGAEFTRTPSIAVVDRASARVSLRGVPDFCNPQAIADASGAAILLCGSPPQNRTVRLLSPTQASSYQDAPQLEAPVPLHIGQARDGSLAILTDIDPLTVAVRAPLPVEASDAWHRVRVDNALAYRVIDGGAIVAVTAPSLNARAFSLILVSLTGVESILAQDLELGEGLEAIEGEGADVVVRRRGSGGKLEEKWFATSGGL